MLNKFHDYLIVNGKKNNTIISYCSEIKLFFNNYSKFNQDNVFNYIKNLRQNKSTSKVNQFIKAGKLFCNCHNLKIEFPKLKKSEEKEPTYISEEEFLDILKHLSLITGQDIKYRAVLALMFYTGMRREEIVNLTRADIDLEKNLVHIKKSKTGKFRIIPFPQSVGKYVKQYFILQTEKKNAFNTSGQAIFKLFAQIKEAFNLKNFHPHILRHSCVMYLFKNKIPANEIQLITGHKNLESLQIYSKCKNEEVADIYSKRIKSQIDKIEKRRNK